MSRWSMKSVAWKPSTSPASVASYFEASKRVIGPIPDRPSTVASHQSAAFRPVGATTPTPVKTARRSGFGVVTVSSRPP
jgi:hypothetical protein